MYVTTTDSNNKSRSLLFLFLFSGIFLCFFSIFQSSRVIPADDPTTTTHHDDHDQDQVNFPSSLSSSSSSSSMSSLTNPHNHHQPQQHLRGLLNGISTKSPLFVLSLPNSGSIALQRYFQCSGLELGVELGRYFTNQRPGTLKKELQEIGKCIYENWKAASTNSNILQGCGDYQVWIDMDIARYKLCYYPSLHMAGFLRALVQHYPRATILQVVRRLSHDDVIMEWIETLPYELRERWSLLCQNYDYHYDSNVTFPTSSSGGDNNHEGMIQFYHWYVNHVRKFVTNHPTLRYIEIDLDDPDATAKILQKHLGVDPQCWYNSIDPRQSRRRPTAASEAATATAAAGDAGLIPISPQSQPSSSLPLPPPIPRPNDITYPLLVAALSKSGTTTVHDYFTCGLGAGQSIHTWTKNSTTKQPMFIGECLEYNIQHQRPLLQECSYYKVWTDIQYLMKPKGVGSSDWSKHGRCFFPTLEQNGGLQSFAKYYPRGTLLHVYRNATNWYQSTKRWNDLSERWSISPNCHGGRRHGGGRLFPLPGSSPQVWEEFYINHTRWVRQFASNHPSITYVEVALEDPQTPKILQHVFGIPTHCWGISNANRKKQK